MPDQSSKAKEMYNNCQDEKGYLGFYQNVLKRVIDVVLCLLALPFCIILCIPFVIAIKHEDHGPIFYRSKRIGKHFKEFEMYKFRSMKVNAPDIRNRDGSTYNSENDLRVTRIGSVMRENSIDELPQILNVLRGQMSIIGPRAGDTESKDTYEDDEKDKMLIKPGITGYTQAYYRNGLSVRDKRLFDAWYAHKVSFYLDVKILFRTIKTVLTHENLYTNNEREK